MQSAPTYMYMWLPFGSEIVHCFVMPFLQCMIYLLIKLPRITTLLTSDQLHETLGFLQLPDAIELDPLFDPNRNIDYNSQGGGGVSRQEFIHCYHDFIQFCKQKHLSSDVRERERERIIRNYVMTFTSSIFSFWCTLD